MQTYQCRAPKGREACLKGMWNYIQRFDLKQVYITLKGLYAEDGQGKDLKSKLAIIQYERLVYKR
jgi:hypothetical protein